MDTLEPRMDRVRTQQADRWLGWMMSVGGIPLLVGQTLPALDRSGDFAAWWNLGGSMVVLVVVANTLGGLVLPIRLLRCGWVAAPVLGSMLNLTTFVAYRGTDPEGLLPWAWTLEPVLVSYLVLCARPLAAVAFALLSGSLPALSGLLVLGHVPAVVAANTPAHVSNVGFVAIFLGIRAGLTRLHAAEKLAEQQETRRLRSDSDARRKEALARLVHDDLLSVLTATMTFSGAPPEELRREARSALVLLERVTAQEPVGKVGRATQEVLAGLVGVARGIDPSCRISSRVLTGVLPDRVVEAVGQAMAEALRNSVRHAGQGATREVDLDLGQQRLTVIVCDDGKGFDPAVVDPSRLGMRDSILGRMADLLGGCAVLDTAPGAGTRVMLTWAI